MASPKRPKNNQRRTLNTLKLANSTPSTVTSVSLHSATPSLLNLDIPVGGDPAGLEIHSIDATGDHVGTSPGMNSPTQLQATFAVLPIAVWVAKAGGLANSTGGGISPAPKV